MTIRGGGTIPSRSDKRSFALDASGIDAYSEHLAVILARMGVERRNALRIRLAVEETLLRMRDHFGCDAEITATVASGLGGPSITLAHSGEPFNPLGEADADSESSSLPAMSGLRLQYSYVAGKNILRLPFPHPSKNPAVTMLASLGMGVLVGLAGLPLFSSLASSWSLDSVFAELFDLWVRTLNALAAPVIFFMVMATLLDMRTVDERGGSRNRMLLRYLLLSLGAGLVAVTAANTLFGPAFKTDEVGTQAMAEMLSSVSQLIPKHVLDPFVTSNTAQLLLLAFVLGNAVIALGERARQLSGVIRQINLTTSLVTRWVSSLAPLFAGVLLALEIWGGRAGVLIQLWKPMILSLAISAVFMAGGLARLCISFGTSTRSLLGKLSAPFLVALRTGSLDDAYGEAEHSCVRGLGMDETFTSVSLPQGLVLYMPASIMGTLVFTVFAASVLGVETSPYWYATAIVLDVAFFVATPSVPGANLLAFIALFQQLGLSQEVFLDAMIFDILFGMFANASNQLLLQVELALQADRLGMLKHTQLS